MNTFISTAISYIVPFAIMIGVGALLIAIRFIFDHDKMKARALDDLEALRADLKKLMGVATCSIEVETNNSESDTPSAITERFFEMLSRMREKEQEHTAQVSELLERHKRIKMFNRINSGTGEWLTIAQEIEATHTALAKHAAAFKLEAGRAPMNDPLACDR